MLKTVLAEITNLNVREAGASSGRTSQREQHIQRFAGRRQRDVVSSGEMQVVLYC